MHLCAPYPLLFFTTDLVSEGVLNAPPFPFIPPPTTDLVSDGVLDSGDQDTGQVLDHGVLILPVMVVLHHLRTVLSLCTYSIKIQN